MSDRWGEIKMDFFNGQSASEAAQSRIAAANASIRAPSQTVPSDRWQPGEWGRWTARENDFRSRAAAARKEVEKNLVGPVHNALLRSLSEFPPEAQRAVSLSFLKLVLMWAYSFYAIGVSPRPLDNPAAVSYHFHKMGYPFRDNGEVMLFFNMFHQRASIRPKHFAS
ncbi:uncharacterized protein PG998_012110 [Apiospora kogelbergensis]|uniref:uncharacterized protein n=1 Tax=Apiospora kogelbergensis TaxID=1337665 RepID=UPI00312F2D64